MRRSLRVQLDFDESADPIAGTVTAGREQRPFTGWLGLIAGLEHAIGGWERREPGEAANGLEGEPE
jgi:hypothetical protein